MVFVAALAGSVLLTLKLHWADFHVYHTAGNSLYNGRIDLYAPNFGDSAVMDYRYPPFFLFLILPLSLLSYQTAEFAWFWINAAVIFFTVRFIKRTFETTAENVARSGLIFFLSFLICAKYFFPLLRNLNLHLILLCLVFAAFCFVLKNKSAPAAFLMALAIAFKAFPILLLPYFALKRQWRFLTLTIVFVAVFNLLPAFYFGFDLNLKLLDDWYRHVMVNNEFHNVNGPINVSLQGQLERHLTDVDYSKRVVDTNYEKVNFASLPHFQVDLIWKTSASLIYLATLFLIWFAAHRRKQIYSAETIEKPGENVKTKNEFDFLAFHEFGLMICAMLLVEPRSNVYYFLALFLPLVPFINSLFRNRSRFNLTAFVLIIAIACLSPLLPGTYTQRLLLVLGVDFYAALILWIALGYNIIRDSQNQRKSVATQVFNKSFSDK